MKNSVQTHRSDKKLDLGERVDWTFTRNGVTWVETYEVVNRISRYKYTVKFVELKVRS